ncbi:MAG TPA: nuclease-related domain-containing protein [Solirubrobacteraceae bacterium]
MSQTYLSERSAAGASAGRRAAEVAERRRRLASGRGRPARLIAALAGPSAEEQLLISQEKQWATGAEGEQSVAEMLARRCPRVPVLHDRRIPRSAANIDHIAVAGSGVFVVDTKRYRGKIEVSRPLFGAAKLKIAGRDRTALIDGLDRQVAAVSAALGDIGEDVPVHGCLCFVSPEGLLADVGLPILQTPRIRGYRLFYPRRLARQLNRPGAIAPERAAALAEGLAGRLSPAVPRG